MPDFLRRERLTEGEGRGKSRGSREISTDFLRLWVFSPLDIHEKSNIISNISGKRMRIENENFVLVGSLNTLSLVYMAEYYQKPK